MFLDESRCCLYSSVQTGLLCASWDLPRLEATKNAFSTGLMALISCSTPTPVLCYRRKTPEMDHLEEVEIVWQHEA